MTQPLGLAALDPIVNGVERQDRVGQHLRLHAQIPSPDLPIRSGETIRLELQAAENGALLNTPVQKDLSFLDVGLALPRDPLIAAVLNKQRPRRIVVFAG